MAEALTRMRKLSAKECHLRIVMGGAVRSWRGWLPGILEEVACSVRQDRLTLVIGGFGGCAGELARFLEDPNEKWPRSLTFEEAQRGNESFKKLIEVGSSKDEAIKRFREAKKDLSDYRDKLHGGNGGWAFSSGREKIIELLSLTGPVQVIDLVLDIMAALPPDITDHIKNPSRVGAAMWRSLP